LAHLELRKPKLHQEHESGASQDPRGVHRQKIPAILSFFQFRKFRLCLMQAVAKLKVVRMGFLDQANMNKFTLK
tara:strand:- start:2 stop:223 length:222 start_codon:yes stop_codon:yes gene_type:complete